MIVLDLGCIQEPRLAWGESHIKEKEAQEWMLRAESNSPSGQGQRGGECGYFREWKHGQKYTGRESSQNKKLFHVVMCRGCQEGYKRTNGSLGATLTSHIKDFGFQSINNMESTNNLSW